MTDWKEHYPDISQMVGKTFTSVRKEGNYEDKLVFENAEETYIFYHPQDCCESVSIEDIAGDLADLEGTPLLIAEDVSGEMPEPEKEEGRYYDDAIQWTFYKFATVKGHVTVRWFGESNGYYSTDVSLRKEVKA